jgi:hypothetical protein
MGVSRSGLLTTSLDDTRVEADDFRNNIYDEHYGFLAGRTFNIMLISWITEHRAERVTSKYIF